MTNPCGCGDSENLSTALVIEPIPPTQCPATVHETVCIQAEVTITPHVEIGDVKSFCVSGPMIGKKCDGTPMRNCIIDVSQKICVQIPITFSATAEAVPKGIVCGTPEAGECTGHAGCTHTQGFFKTHPDVTDVLIGDFIDLGEDSIGTSFRVTILNKNDVWDRLLPVPPQYQTLYIQLLAAKLNVLNGATCVAANDLINAADTFLKNTTDPEGTSVPDNLIPGLTAFNEGTLDGCPMHCPDSPDDSQ